MADLVVMGKDGIPITTSLKMARFLMSGIAVYCKELCPLIVQMNLEKPIIILLNILTDRA